MMRFLTLSIIFICFFTAFSQNIPLAAGGGDFSHETTEDKCLNEVDRSEIKMRLRENVARLNLQGILSQTAGDREDVNFIWPLKKADGFEWNSYYGVSNFVDQNTSIDFLGDYQNYSGASQFAKTAIYK